MLHELLTRDNPAALETRDAAARPRSWNAEAQTIEVVVATDAAVTRRDARGEYDEVLDIAGADLSALNGAHVLNGHRQAGLEYVIGSVEQAWREGAQIIARLRLSSRPEVAGIVRDISEGVIRNASAGFEVTEWQDGERDGRRVRTAVKWRPREISFVPVPADPACRTRQLDPQLENRAQLNRDIRSLCSRAGLAQQAIDDLIDRNATIEDARASCLDAMINRSSGHISIMTARNPDSLDNPLAFQRACGEALYTRVASQHQPSGPARQFANWSIPEVAGECLRRAGENLTALRGHELITRALHTTSDFPLIMADTVGRTLRDSYRAAPSGIRQLARQTTAADFRTKHRLMLDSSGFKLMKVSEHGEFTSSTFTEGEETYRIDTFGRIFGISRQALINDDLGAFTDMSRRLGQAAAAFEIQFLVDLLTSNAGLGPTMKDGQTLFHSNHLNVAQSGAVPDEEALTAARLAMRKQTSLSGELIDVSPWAVLVPSALETVEKLLTAIQAHRTDDVNPFSTLRLLVEPRLLDDERWYVAANPATVDGLEYAYLAGQEGPQIEQQVGFRVDGIEMKVRLDFGAGFVDHRGWYTDEGASS